MEFSHDFAAHSPFSHDFGSSSSNELHLQHYHDFEQQHLASLQDPNSAIYAMSGAQSGQRGSCGDVKPRLTKEQHDILEAHYQKQQKPNTSTKRGFAESLNVSLEKVNNWFQNRRAKSKQDAKKQQGTVGVFNLSEPNDLALGASDSDTSPAFASADYQQMMQHFEADEEPTNVQSHASEVLRTHHNDLNLLQAMSNDHLMVSTQDLHRRTLTQEQFDAFKQQEMMLTSGDLAMLSQDPEVMSRILGAYPVGNEEEVYTSMSMSAAPAIAVPTATNPAMLGFPIARMEEQAISASSSDWTSGSRSSSVSLCQSTDQPDLSASLPSQHSVAQWQPGQSVPVDFHQLNEEFQKAAQARQEQPLLTESPSLTWLPNDLVNRDPSASLVQSMGNVGLQTPQPSQQSAFKSPAPVSSLAARRQRQRPTPLGLASLRSQSYSGTNPASSPGGHMQQQNLSATPQLRRIKSSNVVSGIANGRVQKNVAMPQRSPLSWTFNDAMNSPQAVRLHTSQLTSALAPPTPLSPPEQTATEQIAQLQQFQQYQQQWQSASGQVLQQDSISETDAEHTTAFMPVSGSAPTFSSPPHTPMLYNQPQQFLPPQIVPGSAIMENTPPQSAPASQQCFAQGMFAPSPMQGHQVQMQQPQQMMHAMPPQQVMHIQQPMQRYLVTSAQNQAVPALLQSQFVGMMPPEIQPQTTSVPAGPQFTITTSGPPTDMPMQFAQHGVPIVDAQGQIQMAMPSQLHFVQQKVGPPEVQQPKAQPKFSPGGTQLIFSSSPSDSTPLQITSQVPKQAALASSDFFVHEYTPPQEVKRAATPRKPVDTGPKNYTFANHTLQHFEKASKKAEARSSASNILENSSA